MGYVMQGYKVKPFLIEIFALLYLLNPVGNIIFLGFTNPSYTPVESIMILSERIMSGNIVVIINVIFWFSAIPLAYGLYKVRLWAWYYFLAHSAGMVVLSLFGPDYRIQFSYITILNTIFLIPVGYFISREIRAPYFNPRLRWWEQSPRFIENVTLSIDGIEYETYDFSENGAFIVDPGTMDVVIDELITVNLKINQKEIVTRGNVRWINTNKEFYPIGVGIKFEDISKNDRMHIRSFIKTLLKKGNQQIR
jgi:hypothetical protein